MGLKSISQKQKKEAHTEVHSLERLEEQKNAQPMTKKSLKKVMSEDAVTEEDVESSKDENEKD